MTTRHGKTLWRLRRSGHPDVMLPGEPHSQEFDRKFEDVIYGRTAEVVPLPGSGAPRSFKAAYRLLKLTPDWLALDQKSRTRYQQTIERILQIYVHGKIVMGDGPVSELKRPHVKNILGHFSNAPHMERIALLCLRKLILVALDEEWIEVDPTYQMKRRPNTQGHKAWPLSVMAQYEAKWAIGTRQRTAYALALWLGNRVSDVCRLKWSDLTTKHFMEGENLRTVEGFEFVQFKGRKRGTTVFLPITPMLEADLAPLSRETVTVLVSTWKRPYTSTSLTSRMQEWCSKADIAPGYTMHGLRKALGVKLAEAEASTRQLMETLGHSSIAHAELYSREASKVRLAVQGMDKVTQTENARKKPKISVVK